MTDKPSKEAMEAVKGIRAKGSGGHDFWVDVDLYRAAIIDAAFAPLLAENAELWGENARLRELLIQIVGTEGKTTYFCPVCKDYLGEVFSRTVRDALPAIVEFGGRSET